MEAALTASVLGHETVLFERENQLGGQLNPAGTADFKWPVRMLKEHLISQLEKSAVTVKIGTEATPERIAAEGFEAVILALGAEPAQNLEFPCFPFKSIRSSWHSRLSL